MVMSVKKLFICVCFLVYGFTVTAQQKPRPVESKSVTAESTEITSVDAKETEQKSEYEEKLEILKYGLTGEVVKLIEKLQADNDTRFNNELTVLFRTEKNEKLKNTVLAFFMHQKNEALTEDVTQIILDFYDYNLDFVKACIQYCTELKITEEPILQSFHTVIDDKKPELMEVAIIALGKLGGANDAVYLTDVFYDYEGEDKKDLIVRQTIMQALIDLHAPETEEFLTDKATDTYENVIVRARAITALGKIGTPDSIKILTDAYQDNDPLVREAVVSGLSGFSSTPEATEILLLAFKDEYYKVRLKAIEIAEQLKSPESIPYIFYRAKNDPETAVKNAAIKSLAERGTSETDAWLKDTFNDSTAGRDLRIQIGTVLLKNKPDLIIDDITKAIAESIGNRQTKSFACNLGKSISSIKDDRLQAVAEIFLTDSDAMNKSIGLDMFKTNGFPELVPLVQHIAQDKKNGAIQKRAASLLQQMGLPESETDETDTETAVSDTEVKTDKK